jgi:hypothetical protein
MGECLITRRGAAFKLPVLSEKYPEDVSVAIIKGNTTSATFKVEIAIPGSPAAYTYQWYVDGSPVEGATNSVYTISDIADTRKNTVYCEVTNKKGAVTSRIATLDVVQQYAPVLDESYPQDGIAEVGVALTSKVVIATEGNPAPTYQWYKDGVAVNGATSDSYTFTPDDVGSFTLYCEVTNAAGKVTSRTANFSTRLYLYKAGDECTAKTGGWKSTNFYFDNNDGVHQEAAAPIKNASNMVFKSNATTRGKFDGSFTNKINLAACKKIFADINVDSLYDGASRFVLRVLTGYNIYNQSAAAAGSGNSTGRKTIEINISGLNSSYHIGMTMNFTSEPNRSDQTTVFNVWLE